MGEQSHERSLLQRVLEVNAELEANAAASPPLPPQKSFTAKYLIKVMIDYEIPIYPAIYWAGWERIPLTGSKVTPWLNVEEFARQLTTAGIDILAPKIKLILSNLENGANPGASGRARLPTHESNAHSALEHGDRFQEALRELKLQGAMLVPLSGKEVDTDKIKVYTMGTKIKPNGKV